VLGSSAREAKLIALAIIARVQSGKNASSVAIGTKMTAVFSVAGWAIVGEIVVVMVLRW
jgi:hypothetical protein